MINEQAAWSVLAGVHQQGQKHNRVVPKMHYELQRPSAVHGVLCSPCASAALAPHRLSPPTSLSSAHPLRFRNLEYLEGQLDKYSAARQAEAEEADK